MANPRRAPSVNEFDRNFQLNLKLSIEIETFDRRCAQNTSIAPTSGDIRLYQAMGITGDIISNIAAYIVTTGTSVTLLKYGIWDKDGNLLGSTPDLSAAQGSQMWLVGALSTPVVLAATQPIYLGLISVAATSPTFVNNAVSHTHWNQLPTGPGLAMAYAIAAQADIASVSLPANATGAGSPIYMMAW
jgi:hypothetical protein